MKPMAVRLSKPAFAASTRGCQYQVFGAARRTYRTELLPSASAAPI
jgi:hypothetical protein